MKDEIIDLWLEAEEELRKGNDDKCMKYIFENGSKMCPKYPKEWNQTHNRQQD